MPTTLTPKDHAEAVALFRAQVIGTLSRRDLDRGELRTALVELSQERLRAPGAAVTRSYAVPTLERWYYRYRKGGLDALRPGRRSDRGRGRDLDPVVRTLLLEIRREHPRAGVPLILRTLVADGRIERGTVSESTVRRLYVEHGLDKVAARDGSSPKTRLRWQAERPGLLWHADVCYGPALVIEQQTRPLRIHAILDDASRYVVAIEAAHTEREVDMLSLLVKALRRNAAPDVLYLDNGSTYRGDVLGVACGRLGVALVHARPRDPQARGKMERFWRTLREGCLDYAGGLGSLHDVQVRLLAFLDQHYHQAPHASLLGRSPGRVWAEHQREPDELGEASLREALTVHERRRVRRDSTVPVDGRDWELDQGFLAGRVVTVGRCLLDPSEPPWVEHEGKRLPLHPVDPVKNSRRPRPPRRPHTPASSGAVPFDPPKALLDRAVGRRSDPEGGDR